MSTKNTTTAEVFKVGLRKKSRPNTATKHSTGGGEENILTNANSSSTYNNGKVNESPQQFRIERGDMRSRDENGDSDNNDKDTETTIRITDNKSEEYQASDNLCQRLGYLLDNGIYTDVIFKVGPNERTIEAHRIILASASSMFQLLLYQSQQPIMLNDKMVVRDAEFSLPPFRVFLAGIYTNEIPINLSLEMSLQVFHLTKKYKVTFLERRVLEHILQSIAISNVFVALKVSTTMMELTPMVPICWKIIEENTSEVIQHHIETMDQYQLLRILERDQLNIEEVALFQLIVRWAAIQCRKKGLKSTGKNKRNVLEPLLKYIRFTTMSVEDLQDIISPARILEQPELAAILSHVNRSTHKIPVPYKPVLRLKPKSLGSFHSSCCITDRCHVAKSDSSVEIGNLNNSDTALIMPKSGRKLKLKKNSARSGGTLHKTRRKRTTSKLNR